MAEEKRYKAKVDLPGGVKSGDTFMLKDKVYVNERTGKESPYNCAKETKFFEKVPDAAKYKPGEYLRVDKSSSLKTVDGFYADVYPSEPLLIKSIVPSTKEPVYICERESGETRVHLAERIAVKVEFVYFWNSKGILSRSMKGVNLKMEEFGKQTGNLFEDKKEDELWLTWLKSAHKARMKEMARLTGNKTKETA